VDIEKDRKRDDKRPLERLEIRREDIEKAIRDERGFEQLKDYEEQKEDGVEDILEYLEDDDRDFKQEQEEFFERFVPEGTRVVDFVSESLPDSLRKRFDKAIKKSEEETES
jgi:hypothetical protein